MARCFFNLHEYGTSIPDLEGVECDPASLREPAILGARDMMSASVKKGALCVSCRVDVNDAAGNLVVSVPFREALEITGM